MAAERAADITTGDGAMWGCRLGGLRVLTPTLSPVGGELAGLLGGGALNSASVDRRPSLEAKRLKPRAVMVLAET